MSTIILVVCLLHNYVIYNYMIYVHTIIYTAQLGLGCTYV